MNEVGVFVVSPFVMRIGTLCGTLCFLVPVLFLARPLHLLEWKPKLLVYRARSRARRGAQGE